MNRKETTRFLSKLLENTKLSGMGKYYAKEVSLDYGTSDVKRVDYLQFVPPRTTFLSDIEKAYLSVTKLNPAKRMYIPGMG